MLLRNLSIEEGLCNGTRLLVTDLRPNVIAARKLLHDGSLSSEKTLLPRITLKHDAGPFELYRHQFPVISAHAITVNKSQGQSFNMVGVYLEKEVWSHGMLYVALSRTKSWDCLKIQLKKDRVNKTKNFVYPDLIAQAV
uniref:ATP-dependent DNA helicase n=1 Tax=Panagrolaimus sp. ES5 TaxID=591445 RepID=A0AC34GDI8_9BILA